ncbi:MAG: hypothetical protein MZV64_35005 [Ignavibacteriales bacterium]|nr:hypothetical protein [Ignavibacteriales bacterium]
MTIMTKMLYPTELPVRQTSWYIKEDATFSDALAAVRKHLWSHLNYERSPQNPDLFLIPQAALLSLVRFSLLLNLKWAKSGYKKCRVFSECLHPPFSC